MVSNSTNPYFNVYNNIMISYVILIVVIYIITIRT